MDRILTYLVLFRITSVKGPNGHGTSLAIDENDPDLEEVGKALSRAIVDQAGRLDFRKSVELERHARLLGSL